jgi:hypothetical protein
MRLTSTCRGVLFALSLLPIASFSQTSAPPDTMWRLLDDILKQAIEQKSLEALFGTEPVVSAEQYGMKYLWPETVSFPDGLQAQQRSLITLRNPRNNAVAFEVSGRCVNIAEIKSFYPDMKLTALPTHGYPDAAAAYTAESQARKVSFAINVYSHCLVSVAIRSE